MNGDGKIFVMLPKENWEDLVRKLEIIQLKIESNAEKKTHYMTAKEFMETVRIGRTKFDRLVSEGRIKVLKKKRKIYVDISQVKRYFEDPAT